MREAIVAQDLQPNCFFISVILLDVHLLPGCKLIEETLSFLCSP